MRTLIVPVILCMMVLCSFSLHAQEASPSLSDTLDNVLLEQQYSLGLQLNTNGWGIKFRRGKNLALLKQFMWELEFSTYKSAKEVRTINPYYSDAKSFIYGKLNYLYFLRGGIGFQRILNRKPYWGGVQLSLIYYGGVSVGITKPVYLFIVHSTTSTDYMVSQERYNPAIHFLDNIYGRGPFLSGFSNLEFHPGVYAKAGLEFEFGTKSRAIKALEAGLTLDYSPMAIAIMAYNPKQSLFLTAYISFSFGKRFNKY
ncbi:MAG: hypothetical protein NTU98_02950 [Bacteroidetes bacterium]|nr:hypothetical protein [Bacteroidota bacterium]